MKENTVSDGVGVEEVEMACVPEDARIINVLARVHIRHGEFVPSVWTYRKRSRKAVRPAVECKPVEWRVAVHVAAHTEEVLLSDPDTLAVASVFTLGRVLVVTYADRKARYTVGSEIIEMLDGTLDLEPAKATRIGGAVDRQSVN